MCKEVCENCDLGLKRNDCSEYDFIECCKQNDKTFVAIKQFKLKENVTINELIKDGFSYSCDCKYLSKIIPLKQTILAWIKVSLKDYNLSIDVIDDEYCQCYTPFYEYQKGNNEVFDFLEKVINRYNYELSKSNVIIEEA